jgi:hypothetical protein
MTVCGLLAGDISQAGPVGFEGSWRGGERVPSTDMDFRAQNRSVRAGGCHAWGRRMDAVARSVAAVPDRSRVAKRMHAREKHIACHLRHVHFDICDRWIFCHTRRNAPRSFADAVDIGVGLARIDLDYFCALNDLDGSGRVIGRNAAPISTIRRASRWVVRHARTRRPRMGFRMSANRVGGNSGADIAGASN